MGKRLSRIYTRGGDHGETGLGDGSRVRKSDVRVAAYGDVDELNSALGVVRAIDGIPEDVIEVLTRLQHDLFDAGAELCIPGHRVLTQAHVETLESTLDRWNTQLGALDEFILPGGHLAAAHCHLARTICRRAERTAVALLQSGEDVPPLTVPYLNRLSDLLFVMARWINASVGVPDHLWQKNRLG